MGAGMGKEISVSTLPQYIAFKGDNGKYLGFYIEKEHRGFLKFEYDDLTSPYVKHELVVDPTDESYVHIKCCYNNKFWRPLRDGWIIAGADSIDTDKQSCSCTLFQARFPAFDYQAILGKHRQPEKLTREKLDSQIAEQINYFVANRKVTLKSVKLNKFVACLGNGEIHSCLFAGDECGVMTYYDVGWMAILPKYVAFKGDNGNYLAAFWTESHEYLQFNTTDIGNGRVRHEVVPVGDGTVRLKCLHWNKFWRRSPNWIWADTADYDSNNGDLIFQPILVDQHSVALRCVGNNWFCKRLSTERKTDCLNAGTDSLERSAILRVEEPTLSRRVHSVKYDIDSAHIYDFVPLVLCKATANNTSRQATTLPLSFSYTEKKSSSWKNAVSLSTGMKATFNARIPVIAKLKVEICGAASFVREWGETEETQTKITSTYHAPVGPGKTVEVSLKGTHAKCDVKFSYVQEDLLTTGYTVKSCKNDGVFIGTNYIDIQYETRSY